MLSVLWNQTAWIWLLALFASYVAPVDSAPSGPHLPVCTMGIIIYTLYTHHRAEGHQARILCTQGSYSFHIPWFCAELLRTFTLSPWDYQPKFRCMRLFSRLRKLRLEVIGTTPEYSARISLHQYISNWLNPIFQKAAVICKRWMAGHEWRDRYSLKTQWQLGHPGGWAVWRWI